MHKANQRVKLTGFYIISFSFFHLLILQSLIKATFYRRDSFDMFKVLLKVLLKVFEIQTIKINSPRSWLKKLMK